MGRVFTRWRLWVVERGSDADISQTTEENTPLARLHQRSWIATGQNSFDISPVVAQALTSESSRPLATTPRMTTLATSPTPPRSASSEGDITPLIAHDSGERVRPVTTPGLDKSLLLSFLLSPAKSGQSTLEGDRHHPVADSERQTSTAQPKTSTYLAPGMGAKCCDRIPKASALPMMVPFAGLPLKPPTPRDVVITPPDADLIVFLRLQVRVAWHMPTVY